LSPVAVGVVGLGKMGLLHAAVANALPGSRLAAVAEPTRAVREALASYNPAVRAFPTLAEMAAAVPLDAVVVATPVDDHVDSALACVERRLPFFVEKPLATTAAAARPLLRALAAAPLPNRVGFMTRFVDPFARAREALAAGCLGRLQRAAATIYVSQLFGRGRGWRYERRRSGGGVLINQGSHLLDLLTWYLGPVARVNARTQAVWSSEVEDFAHLALDFESGVQGWLDCSWSVRGRRAVETTVEVLGERGALTVTDDTLRLELDEPAGEWPAGATVESAADLYRPVPVDVGGPQYTRELQGFLEAVAAGRPAPPDAAQGFHVQAVIDAAYRSAAAGGAAVAVEGAG
jgi:predicted dehydrogenase